MIVVEGPDGAPIPFRDGTSHDAIAGYMQARYGLSGRAQEEAEASSRPAMPYTPAEPAVRSPAFAKEPLQAEPKDQAEFEPPLQNGVDPADIAKSGGIGVVKG